MFVNDNYRYLKSFLIPVLVASYWLRPQHALRTGFYLSTLLGTPGFVPSSISFLSQPLILQFNPRITHLFLHTHYAHGGGGKLLQGYLEFWDTYEQNSNGCIHVFELELFNGVVDDVTGSRVIPEIDMAVAQAGSNTIPAHRTARNKIPTAIPMFSMT